MKFTIKRTGIWGNDKPCDEATPYEVKNNVIKNGETEKCWAIEINSLEDLIALYRKYGELVIQTNMWDRETPEIEIYDDYRE